jgi:folate-binding protein YgfZ
MLVYRVPGPRARLVVLGPSARAQAWWRELRAVAAPAGSDRWRWLDIVSGVPQVFAGTAEEFVPQTMNLDLLEGISFKKGCYTGQEIVARMHYLGRLKQRMVLLHAPSEECAKPGDRVFAAGAGGQPVGTVADGQTGAGGGCDLLAVVQLAALAAGTLHLHGPAGPALEIRELPYPLPPGG